MAKWYMIDIGLAEGDDEELEATILQLAAEHDLNAPSSGFGFGFRDMQFETLDFNACNSFDEMVEGLLTNDESYCSVGVERRGWLWGRLCNWADKRRNQKWLDRVCKWQTR